MRTYDSVINPMKEGEPWLTVTHNARVGQIYESDTSRFVIAPTPKGPAGIGSIAGVNYIAVLKETAHKDLALKLIEYLTRPEIMLKMNKRTGGFIPPVNEAIRFLGDTPRDEVIEKGTLAFIPDIYEEWKAVKLVFDQAFYKLVLEDGAVDLDYLGEAQDKIDALKK